MIHVKIFLGSFFYTGFLPGAPGTWASLFTLVPVYFISVHAGFPGLLTFLFAACAITLLLTPYFEELYGSDPAPMVTDEAAGQTLTFLFIPLSFSFPGTSADIVLLLAGFILFRLFDIFKPLGIGRLQSLKSGTGVLTDDLAAGFYAYLCLKLIILLMSGNGIIQ